VEYAVGEQLAQISMALGRLEGKLGDIADLANKVGEFTTQSRNLRHRLESLEAAVRETAKPKGRSRS
jgi:hypothetical protein